MKKIGFIGMGNMGQAFAGGLLSDHAPEDIMFSCHTREKKEKISAELGIRAAEDNSEVVRTADIVILAIKPQMYEEVLNEIKDAARDGEIFISIAPGKTIEYVRSMLGGNVRVVRAMPNTPALVGCGTTGISYDESLFDAAEIEEVEGIFRAVGRYRKVPEEQMSAVVCASGSSPAYVYMFINELAKACEAKGLDAQTALYLSARAVLGAAEMVLKTGEDPEILKERVCSKGGTTIAGIEKLVEGGFSEAIAAATQACYDRSEELARV